MDAASKLSKIWMHSNKYQFKGLCLKLMLLIAKYAILMLDHLM